jgi:hypothetical protein
VIKIRDISPISEMLFANVNNIINKFIVAASRLKRILNRCLYWRDKAANAIKNPVILIKSK